MPRLFPFLEKFPAMPSDENDKWRNFRGPLPGQPRLAMAWSYHLQGWRKESNATEMKMLQSTQCYEPMTNPGHSQLSGGGWSQMMQKWWGAERGKKDKQIASATALHRHHAGLQVSDVLLWSRLY
jgi:hypothetical protein